MGKPASWYPSLAVGATGRGGESQAGAITLARTASCVGLVDALSAGLRSWRKPLASHDPGKIICDLAISVALGGDSWPVWRASVGRRAQPCPRGPWDVAFEHECQISVSPRLPRNAFHNNGIRLQRGSDG